jgi:SAM-dependent methyltransferase
MEYAFPHDDADEDRRLELFEQRLDPLTRRRIERLGIGTGAHCLEIAGGRGSVTRWLCRLVGPNGQVTATDVDTGFLARIEEPNLTVRRHDVRADDFPEGSFDLIHTRAVLMHIGGGLELLRRMASWLAPGGWLVLEEPDFGMWLADFDRVWTAHPSAWHEAFPNGSLSKGRALLRQIHQLGLEDVGADAELDVVAAGTPLAEFHRLSFTRMAEPLVASGLLTPEDAVRLVERVDQPDFLSCGFAYIGAWGRRPAGP